MLKITIKNLKIKTYIGCNEKEKKHKKTIFITYSFDLNTKPEKIKDNLKNTIDYHALSKLIKKNLEAEKFNLIETVAQKTLAILLVNTKTKYAEILVNKPKPFTDIESATATLVYHQN